MANEALFAAVNPEDPDALDSQTILKNLGDAERQRYAALQDTFESDGWPLILEWAGIQQLQALKNGADADSWEQSCEERGVRRAWGNVLNLEDTLMVQFELLARQAIERDELETLEDDLAEV